MSAVTERPATRKPGRASFVAKSEDNPVLPITITTTTAAMPVTQDRTILLDLNGIIINVRRLPGYLERTAFRIRPVPAPVVRGGKATVDIIVHIRVNRTLRGLVRIAQVVPGLGIGKGRANPVIALRIDFPNPAQSTTLRLQLD